MQRREIEEMYETEANHWWFAGKRLLMRSLLGKRLDNPDLRILDVGCGAGATAVDFSSNGWVCACDRSLDSLEFVGKRGIRPRVAGDATRLPFLDGAFDIVLALDIIEHVEDDSAFVAELGRILAPGGVLAVHVPAWPSLWSRHDEVLEHKRRYTRKAFRKLLQASPLRIDYLGWSNCTIFLPTVGVRWARRMTKNEPDGADLGVVPEPVNKLLLSIYAAEAKIAAKTGLPFGVSLAAIATRPGAERSPSAK
jgi:SAM-dependent methyltransferase